MRWLAVVVSSAVVLGCSSGDFVVGANEDDAAVDTGSVENDSTTEETAADTGEPLDTTAGDTGTGPETMPPPDSSLPEVIVSEVGPPVDASTSCTTNAECGTSNFCFRTGCGGGAIGKCGPVPSGLSNYGPMCGCDGITYWNAFHAATFSVGVRSEGPCPLDARVDCAINSDCPSSAECVFQYEDATGCTSGAKGACWRMPSGKICPIGKSGPPMKTCGTASLCTSQCEAVKAKLLFYPEACGV